MQGYSSKETVKDVNGSRFLFVCADVEQCNWRGLVVAPYYGGATIHGNPILSSHRLSVKSIRYFVGLAHRNPTLKWVQLHNGAHLLKFEQLKINSLQDWGGIFKLYNNQSFFHCWLDHLMKEKLWKWIRSCFHVFHQTNKSNDGTRLDWHKTW